MTYPVCHDCSRLRLQELKSEFASGLLPQVVYEVSFCINGMDRDGVDRVSTIEFSSTENVISMKSGLCRSYVEKLLVMEEPTQ